MDPVTHLTHRSHYPQPSPLTSSIRHHHHHHQSYHHVTRRHDKSAIDPFDNCVETYSSDAINVYGCYDSIFKWFQRTIETLSVLGFCVITFLKVCFAFILRYEIKEMIQKIQMLKGENGGSGSMSLPAAPLHELEAYLPRASIQQDTLLETQMNQCQSPPSSSVTAIAAQSTATGAVDTHPRQHRINSRVDQVRHSLTSASTITTTAIMNSSPSTLKSPPPGAAVGQHNTGNNGNNNHDIIMTSSSSSCTKQNRSVKPSPV